MLNVQNALISCVQGWARLLRSPFKFKIFPKETPETQLLKRREGGRGQTSKTAVCQCWLPAAEKLEAQLCTNLGRGKVAAAGTGGGIELSSVLAPDALPRCVAGIKICWHVGEYNCECWASFESTAIAEERKREESVDLFWPVMIWATCVCETSVWCLGLLHWCQWNLPFVAQCT